MERNLLIAAQHTDDVLTLELQGELDIATVPQVRAAVAGHADGHASIVLDLHKVEFIDSSGLRLLLELNADQAGSPVYFRNPSHAVARLLDVTGVRGLLKWQDR